MSDGGAKMYWPPKQESTFRLKDEAGNSIECNRIYYRVIYLLIGRLGWSRLTVQQFCTNYCPLIILVK